MKRLILLAAFAVFSFQMGAQEAPAELDDDMPQPYTGPQPGTPEFKEKFGDMGMPQPYTGPQPGQPGFDPTLLPPPPSLPMDDDASSDEAETAPAPESAAGEDGIEGPADKIAKLSDEEKKQLKKDLELVKQQRAALVKKLIEMRKKYGFVPEDMKDILERKKSSSKPKKKPLPPGLAPVGDAAQVEPPKPPAPGEEDLPENLPLMPKVKKSEK